MHRHPNNRSCTNNVIRRGVNVLLTLSLMVLNVGSQQVAAEEHVLSIEEIQQQVLSAHGVRQNRLRDIHRFLANDSVQQRLQSAGFDVKQLRSAVSLLDEEDLMRLAERTRGVEIDLRAGALTNEQLTYVVIALATAVVVILAT